MGTSVRTAEFCRNVPLSTGPTPLFSSRPTQIQQPFSRWNTSASFPPPSLPSPLLWSPSPANTRFLGFNTAPTQRPQQQQVFGGFGPFLPPVNTNSNQGLANTGAGLGLGAVGAIAAGNCLF